jgi:hypothetical protein
MTIVCRCGALLGLVVFSSCTRPASQPAPPPHVEALEQNASAQTALLTLALHPDGSAQLTSLTVKPFAFRRHRLLEKPVGADGTFRLEVRAGDAPPLLVPLDLGAPGEAAGDVRDRWEGGTHIVRAPWLGPDTRYALVRDGAKVLATWGAP